MKHSVDAVYEHGSLKLLEAVDLQEGQRVRVDLHTEEADDPLEILAGVCDGLSEREIGEVEDTILNRLPMSGCPGARPASGEGGARRRGPADLGRRKVW